MQSQEFKNLMMAGTGLVFKRLYQDMPLTAPSLHKWAKGLARSEEPADYFLHPIAFPLMLLPWWLERQVKGVCDREFQLNLISSNVCMYYYIRLVDNVMDGHATIEPELLPATGYFVNQFHSVYHDYFVTTYPFWKDFNRTWSDFCDVTAADGQLQEVDKATFDVLIGRKVSAAKISVMAVCYQVNQPELIPLWEEWIDEFGRWHLFREDLFDWRQDLQLGTATYFLSEAKRRKRDGESEAGWMEREGLDWGLEQLEVRMRRLREMDFVSPEVSEYLDFREREVLGRVRTLRPALRSFKKFSEIKDHG